jgi:ketosteroid isomerase-like protein
MSLNKFFSIGASFGLLLMGCACNPVVDTQAEAAQIREQSNQWCKAIASGDVKTIMSFFTPESVEMDQDNPILKGIPAITRAQEDWLSDPLVRSSFKFISETIEVSFSGDMAWHRGKGSFTMNTENGPLKVEEKSIDILK